MEIDYLKPENRIRATPLDLLKQGISTRSWEAIDAAYVMLTGESILGILKAKVSPEPQSKPKRGRPKKAKVEPVEVEVAPEAAPAPANNNGVHIINPTGVKNFGRSTAVSKDKRENKFVDDKSVAPNEIDLKPCPRKTPRRPPIPMVSVRCSECGKKEEVDPILAKRRLTTKYSAKYKCNDCIVGAKGSASEDDVYDNDEVVEDDNGEE
jgi:hypothetical protein